MTRTMQKRGGMLLIELLLAILIGVVLLGVLTTMFVQVVVMAPRAREHLESTTTLGRLTEQFRRDVHAAVDATTAPVGSPAKQLSLKGSRDSRIDYEIGDGGVRRTTFAGDQARQREAFALGDLQVVAWEVDIPKHVVSLVLGRVVRLPGDDAPTVRYRFPVTATLARDHRFEAVEVQP